MNNQVPLAELVDVPLARLSTTGLPSTFFPEAKEFCVIAQLHKTSIDDYRYHYINPDRQYYYKTFGLLYIRCYSA